MLTYSVGIERKLPLWLKLINYPLIPMKAANRQTAVLLLDPEAADALLLLD